MLLWKDYVLRNTLDGLFCYSCKVQVMILLQCKNDCSVVDVEYLTEFAWLS